MDLDETEVAEALEDLRERGWAVRVDVAGARVPKYKHALDRKLDLRTPELALLAELLLRGPQTLGELKARTERLHSFPDLEAVRACLDGLAGERDPALVGSIAPQAGKKEPRYAHLLSGEPAAPAAREAAAPAAGPPPASRAAVQEEIAELKGQVEGLSRQLEQLRDAFERFKAQFE